MLNNNIYLSSIRNVLKSAIISHFTKRAAKKINTIIENPVKAQNDTFKYLLKHGMNTDFGNDHSFKTIRTYQDWVNQVPLCDYEGLKFYLDKVISGKENVLWPGKPISFAYTSGTTSGAKYIPVTREFLGDYCRAGGNLVSMFVAETGDTSCITGKVLAFTHNIVLEHLNGIPVQPIAGIAYEQTPKYVRRNFLPKKSTSQIADFDRKLELYMEETIGQNITMIRGIPPTIQMYFNWLIARTGKPIKEIFPNFSLLVHGSVNIEPYRSNLEKTIGKKINTIEAYPASEGFIAFQDSQTAHGLLLNLDGGIFYEFVPANELNNETPTRVSLEDVEIGVNYAIILNTNSGLWGYKLGDTIRFVSRNPYRIQITGRTALYLSTTGEHLIAEEVEGALAEVVNKAGAPIAEFTVAPQIEPTSKLPYHEWYIEFEEPPKDLYRFALELNDKIGEKNINYAEFNEAKIILPLQIKQVEKDGFARYMKSIGKLGGQNKVPHLSNNRKIADAINLFVL